MEASRAGLPSSSTVPPRGGDGAVAGEAGEGAVRGDAADVRGEADVVGDEFGEVEIALAVRGQQSRGDLRAFGRIAVAGGAVGAVGVRNAGEDFQAAGGGDAADEVAVVGEGEVDVAGGVHGEIAEGVEGTGEGGAFEVHAGLEGDAAAGDGGDHAFGIDAADAEIGGVGEVEIALGVVAGEGGLVEGGVEGGAAVAGEAGGAVAGESLDGSVGAYAADDVGGLVAEDEIAGGVEGDAAELGEENVLGGDAGADFAAGEWYRPLSGGREARRRGRWRAMSFDAGRGSGRYGAGSDCLGFGGKCIRH